MEHRRFVKRITGGSHNLCIETRDPVTHLLIGNCNDDRRLPVHRCRSMCTRVYDPLQNIFRYHFFLKTSDTPACPDIFQCFHDPTSPRCAFYCTVVSLSVCVSACAAVSLSACVSACAAVSLSACVSACVCASLTASVCASVGCVRW